MRLIEFGKKGLLCKARSGISIVWKNYKLESLIIVLGILWIIPSWPIPVLNQMLEEYLVETRCSGIAGFASVVIGIYATVWSVFATSASKINIELLKNKVEGPLFFLIGAGLAEAFVATVLCVFIPCEIPHYAEILAVFTILTSVSFVKFILLIMMITKLNIKYIVQEIDDQSAKCTGVHVKLDEIYQQTVDGKK